MSRHFMTLFFMLAILSVAVLNQVSGSCPENEVWSECGGRCQPSCSNPNPICPLICASGCVCKPGYLRNEDGKCIPKDCCDSSSDSSSSY